MEPEDTQEAHKYESPEQEQVVQKTEAASKASRFRDRSQRAAEGEDLELTSGETVKVRRPSITAMVKSGTVPAGVAGSALKFDQGKMMSDRDVQRLFELKMIVTKHALVSPKVVDETPDYENNEIAFSDLTEDEINDIYQYVQVGLEELRKFREKRQGEAAAPSSEDLSGDAS